MYSFSTSKMNSFDDIINVNSFVYIRKDAQCIYVY